MRKIILLTTFMLSVSFTSVTTADNEAMKEVLIRVVNQIDAIMPLLEEAQWQQEKETMTQFHFEEFMDAQGRKHGGLRGDLLAVREGIIAHINNPTIEPRYSAPIEADYVE